MDVDNVNLKRFFLIISRLQDVKKFYLASVSALGEGRLPGNVSNIFFVDFFEPLRCVLIGGVTQ